MSRRVEGRGRAGRPVDRVGTTMPARCRRRAPVRLGGQLDRVADAGTGAVRLDVGDLGRLHPAQGQRAPDAVALAADAALFSRAAFKDVVLTARESFLQVNWTINASAPVPMPRTKNVGRFSKIWIAA